MMPPAQNTSNYPVVPTVALWTFTPNSLHTVVVWVDFGLPCIVTVLSDKAPF